MPIYSDNDAELEDRLASMLAGAGATSSLAAAAAARLAADQHSELTPRLANAVKAMVSLLENAKALFMSGVPSADRGPGLVFPEQIVAKLAEQSVEEPDRSSVERTIDGVLDDLRALLTYPSPEQARRAEVFLAALGQAENAQAQALARGSLELELASLAAG